MKKTHQEIGEYMKLRRTTNKANSKFVKDRDKAIKERWDNLQKVENLSITPQL